MWYPVSSRLLVEPVTREVAQGHVHEDQPDFDAKINGLIASARAHAEAYCNRQLATHEMVWACDSFADLRRLPAAPAACITSINYTDLDGDPQTVPPGLWRLCADGLDPWIARADGEAWPQIRRGSRITLTGTFGDCPEDVRHAILLLIGDGFTTSENAARPDWTAADALLANHRRGAW